MFKSGSNRLIRTSRIILQRSRNVLNYMGILVPPRNFLPLKPTIKLPMDTLSIHFVGLRNLSTDDSTGVSARFFLTNKVYVWFYTGEQSQKQTNKPNKRTQRRAAEAKRRQRRVAGHAGQRRSGVQQTG